MRTSPSKLKYDKKYREKNADKLRECHKKYRAENADKLREYHKQYRAKNIDKIREYQKKYYSEHLGSQRANKRWKDPSVELPPLIDRPPFGELFWLKTSDPVLAVVRLENQSLSIATAIFCSIKFADGSGDGTYWAAAVTDPEAGHIYETINTDVLRWMPAPYLPDETML